MQDFLELCRNRQSCRSFSGEPVAREKIAALIEAATLSPSGCNAQPWSFVVAESPEKVAVAAKCAQAWNGINQFTNKAAAFIIVVEEHAELMPEIAKVIDSQYFAPGDLGAAAAAICLAATDTGLGACEIGMIDRPTLHKEFDIPVDKRIAYLIAIGVPHESKRPKQRKPMEQVVRYV